MKKHALGIIAALVAMAAFAQTVRSVSNTPAEADAGLVIHIDPTTGKPDAPAPGVVPVLLDAKTRSALNTSWDGPNGAGQQAVSGEYLYRLTTEEVSQTRKVVLSK
jgi:hypothetical protein